MYVKVDNNLFNRPNLDLSHLLLPDLVVAVRDQILSHLSSKQMWDSYFIWETIYATSVKANASRA